MDTKGVARFVKETSIERWPEKVTAIAKLKLLDTLGVMFAGLDTQAARIARRLVEEKKGKEEATLFGSPLKVPASEAALANAIAASDLDFDDGHWWGIHPAAAVVPALLAVAERVNATGRELLAAIVAAYEVTLRSADIFTPPPKLFLQHCTGSCGAYGVAAGTAKLLHLDEDRITQAIRIAGAHSPIASLWMVVESGAMAKASIGWGAKTGTESALLAGHGFTGPPCTFDDERNDRASLTTLGHTYEILNSYFKPYSACRMIHPPIDMVLELKRVHSLTADDVSSITVETRLWATGLKNYRPASVSQAVYSTPFAIGAAMIDGEVTPAQMREERLCDPRILREADKVKLVYNPALDEGYQERWKAALVLETKSGQKYRAERRFAKGDLQNPLTEDELKMKFRKCSAGFLGKENTEEMIRLALGIEDLPRVGPLVGLAMAKK